MLGLILIFAFSIYVAISVAVVIAVARRVQRAGRSPWPAAVATAFGMYLLLFWDHVPTVIAHKYYCSTIPEAKIFKTYD
jgi:hypothetical protein